MKFITIIPAYNEEKAIESVVKCALKYCDVLVVDDGSGDSTYGRAKSAGAKIVKHEKNMGKGAAIKSGLKEALNHNYDVLIVLDGDGQHNPDCIPSFISNIGDNELIIGSRFKNGNPENMPVWRKLSNKITTGLIKFVTGYNLTDSQSGFRAMSRDAAELFLDIKYDDYVYESEMLYKASEHEIEVNEASIPCTYGDEKSYVTKIHALKYILFIIGLLGRKFKVRIISNPIAAKLGN
ncbi:MULTISPECIES: glycosyltransferase family 2 protein [Methanobacterium]|jgi:glycosyltransferase involved in cell wall biosynthesis|uniref:Glycosyltransferase family 2 protein n=1 Tax=Methanobacterium veterum TaxID=408577 RepID=A0A9E4ZU66_9EURY|nr:MULTISPECIES: glycosyltransferase family 2 protein [Methanobacterium]MCZ3365254.1 glycosyltransferase family 2 protein [Methanobacterium veterum]MCZ3373009.1 glycosyltransferase family 2 protein [Methanobacterium veterum]